MTTISSTKLSKKQRFLVYLTLIVVFFSFGLLAFMLEKRDETTNKQTAMIHAKEYASILEHRINHAFSSLNTLKILISQNNGKMSNFHEVARELLQVYTNVSELNIAPNGIITEIEPLNNNEKALGLNVLERDSEASAANIAKKTGLLTLEGPIELVEGGTALIGYLPVNIHNEKKQPVFWGFILSLIKYPDIFMEPSPLFPADFTQKYDYQISHISLVSNQKEIIYASTQKKLKQPISIPITIPNGHWLLEIFPKNGWYDTQTLSLRIAVVFLIGFLITEVAIKIFQFRNNNFTIQKERLNYFEQHLAIDEAAIWAETALDGTITFANTHFCLVSGYTKEELEGANHRIVKSDVHPPEFYQEMWRTISSGKVWRGEICNRAKDGHLYWLNTVLVPIFDEETQKIKKYIGIRFDITAKKQAEKEAQLFQKQLHQAQKLDSIGQLTGGIAHDFNNILMGISGYTALAVMINNENENAFNKSKMEKYLQGIEKCSETATNLVGKMLVYCREYDNDAEIIEIEPSSVIFHEVIEMMRSAISSCIKLDFLANETPNVRLNPTALNQIVTNLIINARDAIESSENKKGAITVSLSYEQVNTHCNACFQPVNGWFVVVSVSDNGTGMNADNISKIFDPFFTTKDVGKGTGLGLSVVSGIVNKAGGHILVESELGKGSRFSVLFPPADSEK